MYRALMGRISTASAWLRNVKTTNSLRFLRVVPSHETAARPGDSPYRAEPPGAAEHALDLGDRNPMFLALLVVAAVPIEAIKLHVPSRGL